MPHAIAHRAIAHRAIVHIGMPRTGTTTLQRVLTGLRAPLAERGVLYPELTPASAAEAHLSHQHLGEALDGRRPARERDELFGRLAADLRRQGIDAVILSYESLALARPRLGVPRRLAELFARHGFAMEVLVTVKPQSEYINSMYTWRTQFLREARDFDRYARSASLSRRLRYDTIIAPWRAAAEGRVVGVALHDPANPDPLLARIFARIELADRLGALLDPTVAVAENRSPGPLAVEASRRLAWVRPPSGDVRDITRLIERLAREGGDSFWGVQAERHGWITGNFAAANERFAAAVWGRPWAACVAPAPPRPPNEIAGRAISRVHEARVDALLAAAAAQFDVRPSTGVLRGVRNLVQDVLRVS